MGTIKRRRQTLSRSLGRAAKLRKTEKEDGSKRQSEVRKTAKKRRPGYGEKVSRTEIDDSGKFSEEQVDRDSEAEEMNEIAYKEPTMYDDLLKKLGSRNVSVANALRRRQKEEQGESDTEEDAASDLESSSESEERDDGEDGNDNESPRSFNVENGPKHGVALGEDVGTDDDDDALSDSDKESDGRVNDASMGISTFDNDLSCNLASTEVDNLLKRKWRYT